MWSRGTPGEITGSAASSIGLTGLDGDGAEEYLIRFRIRHGNPGTTRSFIVRPNGVSTSLQSQEIRGGGAAQHSDKWVLAVTSYEWIHGYIWIAASRYPLGGSLQQRCYWSMVTEGKGTIDSTDDVMKTMCSGRWTDNSDNLTTLGIHSTVAVSYSDVTEIGVGTVWEVLARSGAGSSVHPIPALTTGVDRSLILAAWFAGAALDVPGGLGVRLNGDGGGAKHMALATLPQALAGAAAPFSASSSSPVAAARLALEFPPRIPAPLPAKVPA